ncbi:guanine deaminase [Xylaria sp. CBS 124048]|nr:guanine deaminase [Xylaria sp. CBS 124048]
MSPPKLAKNQIFFGTFIHSKSLGQLEYLHSTTVGVDVSGKIVAMETGLGQHEAIQTLCTRLNWSANDVTITVAQGERQFFFPGFIDAHVHAAQYPNTGIFGQSTLMDWLNKYTFPMESSLASLPKARRVYTQCIRRTLSHGTTTAAYYAVIDVASTNLLADLCLSMGQRALVGRVCMDHLSPTYYIDESPDQAVAATRATIEHIRRIDRDSELVTPVITPRFAPTCTAETMEGMAKLHKEAQVPIQTHISENANEIELVQTLFPQNKNYTDVYDAHGLLTEQTILAHAVHLSEDEANIIAERKAKIAHCPCSNSSLASGVARVRWLLEKGITVGLGTDMSGGYSPSILEAARQAKLVSNHLIMPGGLLAHLAEEERERVKLTVEEVLHLATRGGADVVGLPSQIGGFEVGMQWDAQLVDLGAIPEVVAQDDCEDHGSVDLFGWETWDERVAKWVFTGDDRNTLKVWVRGRLVHERI